MNGRRSARIKGTGRIDHQGNQYATLKHIWLNHSISESAGLSRVFWESHIEVPTKWCSDFKIAWYDEAWRVSYPLSNWAPKNIYSNHQEFVWLDIIATGHDDDL